MNIERDIHSVTNLVTIKLRNYYETRTLTNFDRKFETFSLWKNLWKL